MENSRLGSTFPDLTQKCSTQVANNFNMILNSLEVSLFDGGIFEVFVLSVGCLGLFWAWINWQDITKFNLNSFQEDYDGENLIHQTSTSVQEIGRKIHEGAAEFIKAEYTICAIVVVILAGLIFVCVDNLSGIYTSLAFCVGAATSMICGAIGMHIATFTNYRTTICCKRSIGLGFNIAFKAGTVMGFCLVSLSLIVLTILIMLYKFSMNLGDSSSNPEYYKHLFESITGYGLGGSTVALFARVGGGIFTKAADVGADLVGKIQKGLPEDSPRNPATIADNVGDNVGDIAGMGADLFGSFAESTCAALVISCSQLVGYESKHVYYRNLFYPLLIPTVGILLSMITTYYVLNRVNIVNNTQVQVQLKRQLIYSTILLIPGLFVMAYICLPTRFGIMIGDHVQQQTYFDAFKCSFYGLVSGFIIGYVTEIMTSYSYRPVQELAESCRTGAGTNVIYGLSLGYLSTIIPVICLCFTSYQASSLLGYYGVALAAIGMLSNLPICLAIDGYGPISDNAGGIAEMAGLGEQVRKRTDALDSAGNTTAAIGKGFAIGSATLVALALYGAFLHSTGTDKAGSVSFSDPLIFTSLLFGAMLPYAFSALTMKSVGKAALGMVQEVRRQIKENPGILEGLTEPDYKACIKISTLASLKEMMLPGLMVTLTPLLVGYFYGARAIVGFLPGAIVSGVQLAISSSNTGGAWDNAKKYIEAGLLKDDQGVSVLKGSEIHKAAVVGDTVGDPLKDTSGPSLNILIKLMAIVSLVFCKSFQTKVVVP